MAMVFVKPIKGALVRYPQTMTPLAEDGAEVEFDTFWRRRVMDGSVVIVEKTEPPVIEKEITETESAKSDKHERRNR